MEKNIKYLENNIKIKKFFSESDFIFNERLKFINILEKNNFEWKEAIRLSKIWANIKFKKCKYTKKIYDKIKKYDKSI